MDADPGEAGDLLAAQPGYAPARRRAGQAHVLGRQRRPPRGMAVRRPDPGLRVAARPGLEILGGPGAAAQPQFGDVDASLAVNGYNHVCLSVANVDETLAELRKRGVEIVNPPFEIADISARLAFFRDPWGNMFELSERVG
ncbi:VOC family protein [Amycolatopsis sp. NPDC003861]